MNGIDPTGLAAEDAHDIVQMLISTGRADKPERWVEVLADAALSQMNNDALSRLI
jgi:hypothetical protein